MLNKHIVKEIQAGHFEHNDANGLYLPRANVNVGGYFKTQHLAANGDLLGEDISENLVPAQGRQAILDTMFNGVAPMTLPVSWFVGIFEGDYVPLDTNTAANIASTSTECVAYTQATRPAFSRATPIVSYTADNSASRALFTFNANKTVYGAFLISNSTKSGTTGTLMAASRFTAAKVLASAEELTVAYLFSVTDA